MKLAHPLQLLLGPSVWLAWFTLVYAGVSVACAVAPPAPGEHAASWAHTGLFAVTVVVTAALGWVASRCARAARGAAAGRERFVAWSAAALHATSSVSTLVVGLPLVLMTPCV